MSAIQEKQKKKVLDNKLNSRLGKVFTLKSVKFTAKQRHEVLSACN